MRAKENVRRKWALVNSAFWCKCGKRGHGFSWIDTEEAGAGKGMVVLWIVPVFGGEHWSGTNLAECVGGLSTERAQEMQKGRGQGAGLVASDQ